jgi:hypothetical protein
LFCCQEPAPEGCPSPLDTPCTGVSCDLKQWWHPYTVLTNWSSLWRCSEFPARQKPNFKIQLSWISSFKGQSTGATRKSWEINERSNNMQAGTQPRLGILINLRWRQTNSMNTTVTTPNKPQVSNTFTATSAFTQNKTNFDLQLDGTLESLIIMRKEEAHKAVLKPQQMTWGFVRCTIKQHQTYKTWKLFGARTC